MKQGPISTGTATVCAIVMAAVMMTVVAGVLLSPGDGGEISSLGLPSHSPVEAVAGYGGAPVIRITASAVNLTECRVYLTGPDGILHNVETAILGNAALDDGRAAYIFYLPIDDPAASGYWITDEPEMVFTANHHPGVRPFSPGGEWRVVVYDRRSMKNRIDRVVPVNGPSSPA
ncbi:hypothetical protein F8E02_00900 [Methanoculleus sp. Wushi-C6]|uniref:Uncharacterized protein n=1 Tax=Methanoculleus caldifontis TaxID=2651577 RepID=A0ABU3WXY7_9EURY|nr:hypothetical protein [Methanoculleus sp. Wushi-C6]MDV2480586.1 hypothetical protein [Methanoculleus sp. Wushi-C6]